MNLWQKIMELLNVKPVFTETFDVKTGFTNGNNARVTVSKQENFGGFEFEITVIEQPDGDWLFQGKFDLSDKASMLAFCNIGLFEKSVIEIKENYDEKGIS